MLKLNFGGAGSWEETRKKGLMKEEGPGSPNSLLRQGKQRMPHEQEPSKVAGTRD